MSDSKRHWLVKTEPECFSIHHLAASPNQTTCWDGVRNFQARNFMRDDMRVGDQVLLYHSSAEPTAVVGTAVVTRAAYPDHTAWDPNSMHHDPKSTPSNPIWLMVDIRLERIFAQPIALDELRNVAALEQMELLRRGSRLSVQPVRDSEFGAILAMADAQDDSATRTAPVTASRKLPKKAAPPRAAASRRKAAKKKAKPSAVKSRSRRGA